MNRFLAVSSIAVLVTGTLMSQGQLTYPVTKKEIIVDDYFGKKISDPYRWLEDDNSEETKAWVNRQNKVTFSYLEQIPYRDKIRKRLEEVWDYPKYSVPFKEGGKYYFYKNDGLQNQSVFYVQDDLESEPEIMIDPNIFSEDGTIALSGIYFSRDAEYMGYAKSTSGSDWKEFFIKELETRQDLSDHLKWIKFSSMAWAGDGFYYTRYPEPEEGAELSSTNEHAKIYYHQIGRDQKQDELIFEDPQNPLISNWVGTTEDERLLILSRSKGTYGNTIAVKDLTNPTSEFIDIITDYNDEHYVVDNLDNMLLLVTNRNAPKKRLVLVDLKHPAEKNWKTIIPESEHVLRSVSVVGGKIFANYLQDATTRIYVYSLDGILEKEIELIGIGSAYGFGGKKEDEETFYTFSSFAHPPTIYRYDIITGKSTVFRQTEVIFNSRDYLTKQVFYSSKDSTEVPMFITHKKDIILDGENPTLLYGYGGFNASLTPHFSTSNVILLEQGGVYAVANIRGGGEYGQDWHEAGMLLNKQNVFDDFIAAGEYLIEKGYTSSDKLAIKGGSNGGILIGAVINQHPDLCKVALPAVGVMDMLRYHKFTIGWAWATEFGTSDDPEYFNYLYDYSPLHNIKEGISYPATLITTADHDDRVVPAHSFKYAATLQEKHSGDNPVLIRIEIRAGHGAGKPTSKIIEEQADIWSFMFYNMGLTY